LSRAVDAALAILWLMEIQHGRKLGRLSEKSHKNLDIFMLRKLMTPSDHPDRGGAASTWTGQRKSRKTFLSLANSCGPILLSPKEAIPW